MCACVHTFGFCTKAFVAVFCFLYCEIYANYPLLIISRDKKLKNENNPVFKIIFNDWMTF